MQNLKKAFRLIVLLAMLLLATLGIGINGGIPIPSLKRKDKDQVTVEWVQENELESEENSERFI